MKPKFEIETPIGKFYITYGEFMPGDGYKEMYSCWQDGCGIGGHRQTLSSAKDYLKSYIKERVEQRKEEHLNKLSEIMVFLNDLKKGKLL